MKGYIYYYADILYIIYDKPYCKIYCTGNTNHYISYSLRKILEVFPAVFFQCEKSTIVNLSKIKSYNYLNMQIVMEDDRILPLSNRRKKNFITVKNSIIRLTAPFQICFPCHSANNCCESYRAKLDKKDNGQK